MKEAKKFVQPMEYTGLPGTGSWAGYEFMQWTGDVFHPGIDYNWGSGEQDKGKPARAVADGVIEKCIFWNGKTKGFGNHLFLKIILGFDCELDGIALKKGDVIYAHYAHLDSISVSEGQEVNVGDEIGKVGGSGGWPSHLHFELRLPIGKGYEFWPKGYSSDWIISKYLDPYEFIEKYKGGNMPDEKPSTMQIEVPLFEKIRGNSEKWDKTVEYVEIKDDPATTPFDKVRSVIAGYKSRGTDQENRAVAAETELKNRIEQVDRLKGQLLDEEKLRKDLNDKLNAALKNAGSTGGVYEGQLKVKQEQIDALAKQVGEANNKVAEIQTELTRTQAKLADALKGTTSTLSWHDLWVALFEKLIEAGMEALKNKKILK